MKGGAVHHDRLIGLEFGSKVATSNGKNWVYVLHPTPELWTCTLPHRTQIVYSTDCSIITMQLGLRPGSVIVESGTGSAALSHGLVRSVAPHGHLYTFEFHKERAEIAQAEFESHGLSELVTLACRDVCSEGFGLEHVADAVFLDLPKPWEAVESAKVALKASGGRICSFSPCIEQVQKTCLMLEQCDFADVDVMECLQRTYSVRQWTLNVPCMGASVLQEEEDESVSAHLKTAESSEVEMDTSEARSPKRKRFEVEPAAEEESSGTLEETLKPSLKEAPPTATPTTRSKSRKHFKSIQSSVKLHAAQPCAKIPGHTGYLTFATLYTTETDSTTTREDDVS